MTAILFPAGVLSLGVTMLLAHRYTWRRAQSRNLSPADLLFRHGQFRRRMQASSLLAMIGPTMLVGLNVSPAQSPRIYLALWLMVLVATCWICWLALLDALATGRHYSRLGRERAAARARLRHEMAQLGADNKLRAEGESAGS